jgi:UDP:flavonoid glycosyltransferase YjiC (YdhE family)
LIIRVAPDWPPATRVTGAWMDRATAGPLPAALESFVAAGTPPIVIAFGSMAGAGEASLDAAVAAMLDGGRRVVVQGDAAASVESPNLARIGPVDHRALFRRAGLVIHHGGAGTTHAACAAGVPSLVVPHVGDQPYWAHRLHRLGVAPPAQPMRTLQPDALAAAALEAVSDPAMRHRAHELAQRMSAEDGLEAAVAAVERAAGSVSGDGPSS